MSRYQAQPAHVVVGREPERAALARFCESIQAGACALVLSGSAGVGKTALWSLGVREAALAFRVLTCHPGELGTKVSYSGLSELLDGLESEVALLPAELSHALGQALRLEPVSQGGTDHASVALAVASVLRSAAAQPLVLAIDDLQWLDPSSSRVLGFALRRLTDHPVGVLASQRSEVTSELLAAGLPRDRISLLELGPLSEVEVDQLIRLRIGAALLRPLVAQIHQASGGNPLFALELARAALHALRPLAAGEPLPLSNTLRELMGRRIASVSAPTREVLLLVAAAADATEALVERALGHHALAAVRRAMDAGLLTSQRGHLRFTHPLLAATAYDAADPVRRRRIHLLLASLAVDVEERARQSSAAAELPDANLAAQVEAGAHVAYARGAPDAAGALAERALALTPEADLADGLRRAITAADSFWDAGDVGRSVALLERLMDQLPAGSDRAKVLRRLATATAFLSSWTAAQPLLVQGIAEAGDDLTLRAVLHRDLAFFIMQAGDVRASTRDAAEAIRYADRSQDADVIADAETTFLLQAVITGEAPDDLRSRLARLAALPDTEDQWIPTGSRLVLIGAMLKWVDDFDAARALLTSAYTKRWNRQEDGLLIPALFQLGELECWAGHLEEAQALAKLAHDTERRSPRQGARQMVLYPEALAAARAGDSEHARALAQECLDLTDHTGDGRHQMRALTALGFIDISEGDFESAVTRLDRVDMLQHDLGYSHPGVIRSAADHIEALIGIGDLTAAQRRLSLLADQAKSSGSGWATTTELRCRGMLAAKRGDLESAVIALNASVTASERLPDPLERSRTLLALGGVLRRQRRRSEAFDVFARAKEMCDLMGAALWSAKAAAEIQRLQGRGRTTDGLTPMETQVAELVAAGRSNKEVAAEIYLSLKTVEAHLSSVYRKLGVRSRTELAAHLLTRATTDI